MTLPSPRFATDVNFAADGDTWSSSPTKADPGSGRLAEGFEPDSLPAEWLNWILNNHGEWIYAIGTPVSQTLVIPIVDMILGNDPSTGAVRWVVEGSGAFGNAPRARPIVDHAYASLVIKLPAGAILTKIEIMVNAATSRGTSTDRWNVRAFERAWDWVPSIAAPTLTELGSIQDDGTGTGLRLITFSGLSTVVGADNDYPVWIQAPNSVAGDHLLAARVTFTAPPI